MWISKYVKSFYKKRIIIPGYAAAIAGELEDELPDWEVIIGPRDASLIPKFLREMGYQPAR